MPKGSRTFTRPMVNIMESSTISRVERFCMGPIFWKSVSRIFVLVAYQKYCIDRQSREGLHPQGFGVFYRGVLAQRHRALGKYSSFNYAQSCTVLVVRPFSLTW